MYTISTATKHTTYRNIAKMNTQTFAVIKLIDNCDLSVIRQVKYFGTQELKNFFIKRLNTKIDDYDDLNTFGDDAFSKLVLDLLEASIEDVDWDAVMKYIISKKF